MNYLHEYIFDLLDWDYVSVWNRPQYYVESLDDYYEIRIAMPGVIKKDITAKIENGYLIIEAPQNTVYKLNTAFKKVWKMNDAIIIDKITLKLDNGILTVTLPKKETAKSIVLSIK